MKTEGKGRIRVNKFVYVTLHEAFREGIIVKYSKMETVSAANEIKHPIVREALKMMGIGAQSAKKDVFLRVSLGRF